MLALEVCTLSCPDMLCACQGILLFCNYIISAAFTEGGEVLLLRRVCINLQTLCVLRGEVGRTHCGGSHTWPREAWPQGFFMHKKRGLSLPLLGCALALKIVLWVCGCSFVTPPANVGSQGQSVVPEHAHTHVHSHDGGIKNCPRVFDGALPGCLFTVL